MGKVIELNSENFAEVTGKGLALVDFNAEWCGPCQMQAPILEELAEEGEGYTIASLNVDDEADLAREFAVSSIPCLVLFRDGKEVDRVVGLRPKKALAKMLEKRKK